MIVPLSSTSIYFFEKHRQRALLEMGLPLDLGVKDLDFILMPVEIEPFEDRWKEKCPNCKEWFVGGTFCCEDCFYGRFAGGFYHVKFYFDVLDDQPYRLTYFKLRDEVTKHFDKKVEAHKKSKKSKRSKPSA